MELFFTHTTCKEKGKKQVDPEYVKSPLPPQSDNTNRPASTSTSRSVKPFQKGGFLSLLLCCTVGSGSFLDNSDKSSVANSKKNINRNSRASLKDKQTTHVDNTKVIQPIVPSHTTTTPPTIITNQTDLDHLSATNAVAVAKSNGANDVEANTNNVESTSPVSLPPQTSPVVKKKKKNRTTFQ